MLLNFGLPWSFEKWLHAASIACLLRKMSDVGNVRYAHFSDSGWRPIASMHDMAITHGQTDIETQMAMQYCDRLQADLQL